jgi:isoleucyl-tRNA synthetase
VDKTLIDEQLSADMDALLCLVSLGRAARDGSKINVRKPLAELKVHPGRAADRRAVERFADQIEDELNVKKVTLHDPKQGSLLRFEAKPNMKTLGPKFGPRLKEVLAALAAPDPPTLAAKVQSAQPFELPCPGGAVLLDPADVVVQLKAPEGWAGVADRDTQVLVDTRLTEELKREGMARDVLRHVQNARKEAGLEMEDRIVLHLSTESEILTKGIHAHLNYICNETLASWSPEPLAGQNVYQVIVKVDGQQLVIQLRKVARP